MAGMINRGAEGRNGRETRGTWHDSPRNMAAAARSERKQG
jgi:hypothetical protein